MRRVFRRVTLRAEDGLGLIELLIALTLLAIGIGATIASLSSSIVVLQHSSKEGTAITLADRQLEAYRAMPFACVPRSSSMIQPAACPVVPTYSGFPQPYSTTAVTSYDQTVSGSDAPDHRSYVVTTSVSSSATEPQITVTVALTGAPGTVLAQESSYFSSAGTSPTAS